MTSTGLPDDITKKIQRVEDEVLHIVEEADRVQRTQLSGVSISYESDAPRDLLTDDERAQSICFITRYENLPVVVAPVIVEREGKHHLGNLGFLRHALNEYRSIIQNQDDSIHFQGIHAFCRQKMTNRDKSQDLVITAYGEGARDVTPQFVEYLDQRCKAIRVVLDKCEYGYIYNGILQHSDHASAQRLLREYSDGTLNYVFIKHALLLRYIKDCLVWHHALLNAITSPKLGPL